MNSNNWLLLLTHCFSSCLESDPFPPFLSQDLHEEPNRYILTAEVPGIKKEDVQISVDDRLHKLTIAGSTKKEVSFDPSATSTDETSKQPSDANKENGSETQVQKVSSSSNEVSSTKNHRSLISERSYGSFSRSFSFPEQADLSQIKAKFQDGILKLEIPKVAEEKPKVRTVTIEDVRE